MPEPFQPKPKGILTRNKNKISKFVIIATNLGFVVGLSIVALLHVIAPPLAVLSIPSIITLFFQWVAKYAPEKLSQVKELFLQKLEDEEDKDAVSKAYEDVLSQCTARSQLTGRSQASVPANVEETTPTESDQPTQRLPVRVVYNTKTGKHEYEVYSE